MAKRSGQFNDVTVKILSLLITLLLAAMIGSQIYTYINDRHDTQEAVLCTINEDISFEGIIVRNEKQMTYSGSGVIKYSYPDGSKVSAGSTVAQVYDSYDDVLAEEKLASLDEQIALLQKAQNPGTTDYVQPESINRRIDEQYKKILACSAEGDLSDLPSIKNDMSLIMNIYNIISGRSDNYNSRITQLQNEKYKLGSSARVKSEITAPENGYFVSYCDGYEDRLNKDNIEQLSQQDIEDIINGAQSAADSVPSGCIGKMFDDYTALITGVINSDPRVVNDASLRLMLDSSSTVYDVKVVSVRSAGESGKDIVVLSCDTLDDAMVSRRIRGMQLIFDEYSGIKVPRSAIRFRDDQKGVYVILGQDITFKKIDVIYEGDDYVISKNTSDEEYLLLYDQILLEPVSEQDVQKNETDVSSDTR